MSKHARRKDLEGLLSTYNDCILQVLVGKSMLTKPFHMHMQRRRLYTAEAEVDI